MSELTFIIHDLSHALAVSRASVELGLPATVQSAPGLATTLGPEAFTALIEETLQAWPDAMITSVLDCGDQAGTAIGALRRGVKRISVNLDTSVLSKINDIARQLDADVVATSDTALDLLDVADMDRAIRQHLTDGNQP